MATIDEAYLKAQETNTIILNLQTEVNSLSQFVEAYPDMTDPNSLTITLSDGVTTIDNLKKQSDKIDTQVSNFLDSDSSMKVTYSDGTQSNNLAKMAELASASIANLAIIETSGDGNSYLANDGTYKSAIGGVQIDDTTPSDTTTYSSQKVESELSNKQDNLISGINIKTINGQSILGSGDIDTNYSSDLDPFSDGSQIAFYKFEGDTTDLMGGYDGTPTNITYNVGIDGQCALFDGSSSTVTTPLSINGIYSISLLLKINVLDTNIRRVLNFINGSKIVLLSFEPNYFLYKYDGNNSSDNYAARGIASNTLSTSTWYHVVIVDDGVAPKFYVNGIDNSTTRSGSSSNDADSNLTFGAVSKLNAQYFNGSIDQVRVFNRPLTETEALELKNLDLGA